MTITPAASPKIAPFLWFDTQAEEAMHFYVAIFGNSKVISVSRYGKSGPGPEGSVMTATFELDGQRFVALNGGPHYTFTPAISFAVRCETQAEVDRLWNRLLEGGGKPNHCGWLQDKYGLSCVADRARRLATPVAGPRSREGERRHAGDAEDGQA
jgi:predicted 3-demethylubiquinone-9 3-methyltransferase (glyoxalase superfamily)